MNSLIRKTSEKSPLIRKEEEESKKNKIPKSVLREFQEKHRKIYILTTRYNEKTLSANRTFLESSKSGGKYKCIYSSPSEISSEIPTGSKCVVLEMNNDTNRIVGLGLIEKRECKKKLWVQEWGNYNRVHYSGYFRIDRREIDAVVDSVDSSSVDSANLLVDSLRESKVMKLLDLLCFKGSGHLKRGKGLTMFPVSYLYSYFEKGVDIELEIREMFNRRFK
jgi:hypothetical protein